MSDDKLMTEAEKARDLLAYLVESIRYGETAREIRQVTEEIERQARHLYNMASDIERWGTYQPWEDEVQA